ncbi:intermembrane lipid transfer protein VPS13B isoform X4 [Paramormyrops kingsleyae]|uniref:intermembrane lipid transfer protein VPS13B isoform X4 n=1 Tax=Paramormyrops kingsleyae TaxID=1676925 RepID=UPI003B973E69
MLESYVTPLLMSYVNRYIKNLKPSDLQLSLWGGDVVLSKLELRLDVLEQELKLPFTFLSGHIHELRIHVPWTKLGSEPVVITINTMECILKLKDGAQDDHESCGSGSTGPSASDSAKLSAKPRRVPQAAPADPDLPPGYVQSLIRRVVNNVNIVVNNLILKYVEDDIVLSVNITSADCFTVDEFWDRAFMDVTAPDLVLRKAINFSDCTVCLDKRNASGKIEFYQDPLLYKCSFRTRLHFTYDNINAKIPSVIKIQTMVETLKLSITDQQLPMFIRVMELGIALYYGELGGQRDRETDEADSHSREVGLNVPGQWCSERHHDSHGTECEGDAQGSPGLYPGMEAVGEEAEQGWVSWAWSFVPAIVSEDEEEEDIEDKGGGHGYYQEVGEGGRSSSPLQQCPRTPVVSIGFYCTKASVTFKLTETQAESSYYSPQKVKSREVLCLEEEGITIEVLMMGEPFFNCQIGFVGCRALCMKTIMGVKDFEDNMNRCDEDAVFFSCGQPLSVKGNTYLTNSLFDYRSPENNGVFAEFILDAAQHKETYTETAGMQRFSAFFMDYLYTAENVGGSDHVGQPDCHSAMGNEAAGPAQETSEKRLVVGPLDIHLHSSAVHRVLKMVACALDHEYEPYCRPQSDVGEDSRTAPGAQELAGLEEFIPTRLTSVTLIKVSVTVPMAEFNLLDHLLPTILERKGPCAPPSVPAYQPVRPLPALRLQVDKVNLEHSVPMYASHVVGAVSGLSQPSDSLLHHCYAHCYLKVFGFQVGLTSMDSNGCFLPLTPIIPSFSTALYGKLLRLPALWTKRSSVPITECIFELPHFSLQATRSQTLLLQAICQSWTHSLGNGLSPGVSDALLHEVYKAPGAKSPSWSPTLEGSVQNVELKYCSRPAVRCAAGTVGAVKVCARTPGEGAKEKLVPLIQGPSDTRELHTSRWLNEIRKPESLLAPDLLAFSAQVPQLGDDCRNSGAVLLVSVQGIAVNVDPVFCTWLLHQPQRGGSGSRSSQQAPGAVPMTVPVAKRREDEASVGSTPLVKQPSNQASDYASSPVKTKTVTESRPLSLPVKVMPTSPQSWTTPEEHMKELISRVWDGVKRLTLQVELQSCCVFLPNDSLPSPSTIVCGDIPGTVRSWYHSQASMPGTVVVCLPQVSVLSSGHRHMEPLQEVPFVVPRPILEEGDAFPWTVTLTQFSVYTLLGQQRALGLLEPMGCTSTLAVTSHRAQAAFVVCLHVDLEPLHAKCSNPQVQLLYEVFQSWSTAWARVQKRGTQRPAPCLPEPSPGPTPGPGPSSPVRSSTGTALPDTSTCSPSADFGSPTEGDSLPAGDESPSLDTVTLEQKTSSIGGASGKVSLWMQWMLPKVTVKLFAPDPAAKRTEICVITELEDLSASVDVQDVYTKIKCKVGSLNIDHYRNSPDDGPRSPGRCGGVLLSCTDKLNRRTVLVRPVSKQDPFSRFFGFFPPTAAKALEISHQQHGFLSVTYTQAVTKNVRHKLTSRPERGGGPRGGAPRLTEGLADGSPQYLREILLSVQPFDVVLSCPLLVTASSVFRVIPPRNRRHCREAGRSAAGQPMRSRALTSSSLPLIYVNTSIIRIFCPMPQDTSPSADSMLKKEEDTLVLKIGSVSVAPQADNPLSRTVLRKDVYQRALNLGILRDPGSEVEDRQYQVDLQCINTGTAHWDQLKPEKEGAKGGPLLESERNSQNPALEWNMASSIRRQQDRRAILTPILTDFSVRVTAAPAIIFSKPATLDNTQVEEIVVCGHSLEVNVTTSLDFFFSVAQVQLLQQLLQANVVGSEAPEKAAEVRCQESHSTSSSRPTADSSSRHSGAQDSGFGSDSAHIRIVQIEQQSGASHHRIARPSRKSTIIKNLSFVPFDIFLTASRVSLMTYASVSVPDHAVTATSPEKKAVDRAGKSALNMPDDERDPTAHGISTLTAEDLLNSNTLSGTAGGLLSLESLQAPSRSSARQALGVTMVRQPGRRGSGDLLLEPLLYLQVFQPSALLSCHHRKQKLELSVFDVVLKGVAADYKCLDMGKTLPEALDYSVFWLQTVAGEADGKTGIPPPLLSLQIRDFLSGQAELSIELSRPLKVIPTLTRLEQAKAFLKKILPEGSGESRKAPSPPQPSPAKPTASRTSTATEGTLPKSQHSTGRAGALAALAPFHRALVRTAQIVVVLEAEIAPTQPSLTLSVSGLTGSLTLRNGPKPADPLQAATFLLELQDVLLKTGLRDRCRPLLGPFCCSADLEAKWCRHGGSPGPEAGPPKLLLDLKGGLLQVFWGQEHLNCLVLMQKHLQAYLQKGGGVELPGAGEQPESHQPPPSPHIHSPRTEHSTDDLRTGLFQYIQDSASRKLPGTHEVMFYNETDDSPGVMLWRYPEPRALTFVRITPVPFNTTEDPDISTADLGDVLKVPCSLEYWDELQRAFVPYRDFSLSESAVCELPLPSVCPGDDQRDLVASDLWRIILNSTADGGDGQSSDSESGSQAPCEQLVPPTALAACTRVDSCFAPSFVPSVGVSVQLAQVELHLCHHLDQLGTAPARHLRPFLPDRKLPQEQEYLVGAAREPRAYARQWSTGGHRSQELHFSAELDCRLLEYRNLTMRSLVQPFAVRGQAAASSRGARPRQLLLEGSVFVEPVFISVSQHSVHTLDMAVQAWQQNQDTSAEELVLSHYVICNDTHETLRFGQVDTDENVLLASLHSHQYSWRSHRSPQLLHICIEGWGNWRWSEPFSVDNVGMLLRTIQYKGRTASLIIKVQQLNGVQKQIVICGRQVMCSYLCQDIDLRVVQHYVGPDGQTVVREHVDCLEAGRKLPSYVLEDAEMTELCVRARGDEDWSRDVRLERQEPGGSSVVQVPCSSGSLLYVWCTLITVEPNSHMQQRMVIFSPLFIMRSQLPDPIIIHIEKRSLGLRESQLVPGQGQEEPLLNVESDLTHHLTFQAREEEDVSQCAVPISTALIKQIVNKAPAGESHEHILCDFYGAGASALPPWPYVRKDVDRPSPEPLAQWDSPMQVKLSAWKPGLNTLLVELLPWALLANRSHWDLWLFEGEKIVVQIPAGKVIVPPNFKEAFQIGIYWADTNTVHKSAALELVHELTSPRWKEGSGSDVLALDEEGFVETQITLGTLPGRHKVCQFCVSSMVRHGIQILQVEDRTILVNNTPHLLYYRPLLSHGALGVSEQPFDCPDTTVCSLPPGHALDSPQTCSVPCWDVLRLDSLAETEALPPQRHMMFSIAPEEGPGSVPWSLPAPIRPDFPRQSVAVPGAPCARTGTSTRALVMTYQEHLGVTYITLNEDPCPHMLIHNQCPIPLLLKENLRETPRTEVYCRLLPANSSLHHELYQHYSNFPDCRQKEAPSTLFLRLAPEAQTSAEWTDAVDISCPGPQVLFLPSFGCLYIHVQLCSGTIILTLAPEAKMDSILSEQHRLPKRTLAFQVLLSAASLALRDDITSPAGSVELLRLTLSKLLLNLSQAQAGTTGAGPAEGAMLEMYCAGLQLDNQLYHRASFHFPVLLCQEKWAEPGPWTAEANPASMPHGLDDFKASCSLRLWLLLSANGHGVDEVSFQLEPARVYLEDTFVYYIKTLFHTYVPDAVLNGGRGHGASDVPEAVRESVRALVRPLRLRRLCIQPVSLLVSVHASLKLYIASDHTPLAFSLFERGPICTTARQLVHALAMHYAAGALFRAGWVVGSLEILGSPASLVRSVGNGISDFFRLPYEGLTRGPGAFVSGVSRGTTSFVKHISKGTLTSITNLATSLARNMDRLSLDEDHYTRQEEWRRQLPESLGDGLRQGLSRLGISLLGAIAGIVDQPMQNFQRTWETPGSAGSKAKGVISGVGKGIVGVFTKPIGGAAELVSQTGYGILYGAGLWQLPRQLHLPTEDRSAAAPNSHVKYAWKMLQSLGRPEVHMALDVTIVSGSGQEHAGCLLLTSEVLFVVSLSEDTQQQAFPVTEVECRAEPGQEGVLTLTLCQQRVASEAEGDGGRERLTEQQYQRLVEYVTRASQHLSLSGMASQQPPVTPAEPPAAITKTYRYLVEPAFARVFVSKFTMVKNKALRIGFH